MNQDTVDAEVIEHKFVGPNFVIVRVLDGFECKLYVDVRVSKFKDQRSPDGTPMLNIAWNVLPSWKAPAGAKLKLPRPPIPTQQAPKIPDPRVTQ